MHLISHFHSTTSALICFTELTPVNPFSLHVLPVTNESISVCYALEAISAAHLSNSKTLDTADGARLDLRALRAFSLEICRDQAAENNIAAIIATAALLIYYEVAKMRRVHGIPIESNSGRLW